MGAVGRDPRGSSEGAGPTSAQLRVLRAMKDGTVLVRGYVNNVRWYLQGSGASVNSSTADAIWRAGWIGSADDPGTRAYRYFTLTDLGHVAVVKKGEPE